MKNINENIESIRIYIHQYYLDHKKDLLAEYRRNSTALDKIIITISSGGILLTITFFEKTAKTSTENLILLLELSWISFLISIISIIISYKTAEQALKLADSRLEKWYGSSKEEIEKGTLKPPLLRNIFDKLTEFTNHLATIALILGLVLAIVFAIFSTKPESKAVEWTDQEIEYLKNIQK